MNISDRAENAFQSKLEQTLIGQPRKEVLEGICRLLRSEFGHYNWVGIYLLDGKLLRLAAWDGKEPTEHTAISVDKGICGMAVREDRTVVVGDVGSSPEYLACFPYTKSEIVVPIRRGKIVIGEIDIDGDSRNAYDASDQRFLARVAERIAEISIL